MEENKSKLNKDIVVSENIEKSKHGYLIFYCRLCKFSLIIIPLTYMYAQFQVWKYQLMLNGVTNKRYYDDGFLLDGWLDPITNDRNPIFKKLSQYDVNIINMEIFLPYLLAFLGSIAFIKIISLLLKLDKSNLHHHKYHQGLHHNE